MKKRLIAFGMLIVLIMAMSMTVMAADGVNSNEQKVLDKFNSIQAKYTSLIGFDTAKTNTANATAALQDVDLNESACNDLIGILDKLDAELNGSTTKKDLQSHQQALLKIANVTTSNISVSATLDANTGIGSAKIVVMAPGQDVPSQENATTTVTVAIGQGIINQTGVDTTATVAVIGGVALISLLGVGAFIASRSKKVAR